MTNWRFLIKNQNCIYLLNALDTDLFGDKFIFRTSNKRVGFNLAVWLEMTDAEMNALLPGGLGDLLPEDAALHAETIQKLVSVFSTFGYRLVKPPLIEFEESLLGGISGTVGNQTFRLMDPISQRMMGIRADITPQISRIARTRLLKEPRPLRLSYAGEVLRVRGTQLRPSRQLTQVGAELIGSAAPEADAEVILMAIGALMGIGLNHLSVDLTVPRLVPHLFDLFEIEGQQRLNLRACLDRKDKLAVAKLSGKAAAAMEVLLNATGPASRALGLLGDAALPGEAAIEVERVAKIVDLLATRSPGIQLTLDPVEYRGFEYHTGVGFTIFSQDSSAELASGGRYRVRNSAGEAGERATGVTLYLEAIIGTQPKPRNERMIFVPKETPYEKIISLQGEGWTTVMELGPEANQRELAIKLGCNYILDGETPRSLKNVE